MLCKKTYKNQVTLPKKLIDGFKGVEYFDAEACNGKIILSPVRIKLEKKENLYKIKEKLTTLGVSEKDIDKAIKWARGK